MKAFTRTRGVILLRKDSVEEKITGKLSYPANYSSEEIADHLKKYIRSTRKENNLHITICSMEITSTGMVFNYYAEHISKGFLCQKRFRPSSFTIVKAIDFFDSIDSFIQWKSKQIKRLFGPDYNLRIIGQAMNVNDRKILVCLLAYK